MESFWPKKLSHWRTRTRTRIQSNCWIFESNWLDIESQIDLILRVKLTRYWESNWLDIENKIVNLTLNIESIWLKYSAITLNPGSSSSSPVTQLFSSKWLHFFFQCIVSHLFFLNTIPENSKVLSNFFVEWILFIYCLEEFICEKELYLLMHSFLTKNKICLDLWFQGIHFCIKYIFWKKIVSIYGFGEYIFIFCIKN